MGGKENGEGGRGKRACDAVSRAPFPSPFPTYSYLNASTGSSRAALPAGYSPKSTPVRIEEITAATTAPERHRGREWA